MTEEEIWKEFTTKYPQYKYYSNEAFMLNDSNNLQLDMILEDKKISIAFLKDTFINENIDLPRFGELSIIDDCNEEARCVIISKGIREVKLKDVTSFDATKEGYSSIEEWKEDNIKDFNAELEAYGTKINDDSIIIFEDIEVLFKA